jgi:hypothetical protein
MAEHRFHLSGWVKSFRVKNAGGMQLRFCNTDTMTIPTDDYIVDFGSMFKEVYVLEKMSRLLQSLYDEKKITNEQVENHLKYTKLTQSRQVFALVVNGAPSWMDKSFPVDIDYRYLGLHMSRVTDQMFRDETHSDKVPTISGVVRVDSELLPEKYQNTVVCDSVPLMPGQ